MRTDSRARSLFYLRPQVCVQLLLVAVGIFAFVDRDMFQTKRHLKTVELTVNPNLNVPAPGAKVAIAFRGADGGAGLLIDEAVVKQSASGKVVIETIPQNVSVLRGLTAEDHVLVFELLPNEPNPFTQSSMTFASR